MIYSKHVRIYAKSLNKTGLAAPSGRCGYYPGNGFGLFSLLAGGLLYCFNVLVSPSADMFCSVRRINVDARHYWRLSDFWRRPAQSCCERLHWGHLAAVLLAAYLLPANFFGVPLTEMTAYIMRFALAFLYAVIRMLLGM
jgi:hypothetical protein